MIRDIVKLAVVFILVLAAALAPIVILSAWSSRHAELKCMVELGKAGRTVEEAQQFCKRSK